MHYRIASATALALILSGCSTPQHTNLLIFGTNTVVGLKVGADATSTPAIQVGYARQELVLMPLLANTAATNTNGDIFLHPCPAERATPPSNPPTLAELSINCKFVGAGDGAQDSYSVLASFGAKFDASGKAGEAKAGGAIAQYFATGLAARELAEHGSSLVAATESATAEAKAQAILGSPKVIKAIRDEQSRTEDIFARIKMLRAQISGVMLVSGDPSGLITKLDKSLSGGVPRTNFAAACGPGPTALVCAQAIQKSAALDGMDPDDWEAASKAAAE